MAEQQDRVRPLSHKKKANKQAQKMCVEVAYLQRLDLAIISEFVVTKCNV